MRRSCSSKEGRGEIRASSDEGCFKPGRDADETRPGFLRVQLSVITSLKKEKERERGGRKKRKREKKCNLNANPWQLRGRPDAFRIANYSLAAIKFWPGRVAVN